MIVKNIRILVFPLLALSGFVLSNMVQADPVVIKAYKQAFPDARPKCINCHVSALPKKAQGQHEWNAYGLAIKKAAKAAGIPDVPTSDNIDQIAGILKQIGKIEDFKEK